MTQCLLSYPMPSWRLNLLSWALSFDAGPSAKVFHITHPSASDGPISNGPIRAIKGQSNEETGDDEERGVATKSRPKTKKPSMYRVILMNDDYTPMEFVVQILMGIFNKTSEEAYQIMLNVHQKGIGTCGVYTFEIAETKVSQVMDAAKRHQHPLQCTLEKI